MQYTPYIKEEIITIFNKNVLELKLSEYKNRSYIVIYC